MPPRPYLFQRPIARTPQLWICHACLRLRRNLLQRPASLQRPQRAALFHSTARRLGDSLPNHYETLQLTTNATPADVKRQFYTLSKKHHPDRNPDDPTASTRFVAISEAYHILSVPEKRQQYDAHLQQSQARSSRWGRAGGESYPQGSYSSASFGSRPASGLNKKRSTFRGPPPSFYKAGGYGKHGAKRAEYAQENAQGGGQGQAGQESYGEWGGFGPGQQKHGNDVPHFDDRRHKETHDSINEHIRARRRRMQRTFRVEEDYDRGGMLMNFVLVSSVIGLIGITAKIFGDRNESRNTGRRKEEL